MGYILTNLYRNRLQKVTRYLNGSFFYTTYNGSPSYSSYTSYDEKLKLVFSNRAVLKVFKLNCDLFSLGQLQAINDSQKERPNDPLLKKLKNPNPFQSQRQFFWDAMFYYMIGCGYLYCTNSALNNNTFLYWLNPEGLDLKPKKFQGLGRLAKTQRQADNLMRQTVKYTENDGNTIDIKLGDIIPIFDLSNGVSGNWFKGNSAIDALYKVISNSEAALDSKNINLRFAGKYLVSGQKSEHNVNEIPMAKEEQQQIEANIDDYKSVTAVKTMVDIKRYVEDIRKLELDTSEIESFLKVGSMYGIPKEILNASLDGSTFENQQKAFAQHVEYVFNPKAKDLIEAIQTKFGYDNKSVSLDYNFNHLSFMKIFQREEEGARTTTLNNLISAREQGILTDEEFFNLGRQLYGLDRED